MMDFITIIFFDNILKGVYWHSKLGKKRGDIKVHMVMKYYMDSDKKTIHSHNLYQILTYVMNKDRSHEGNVDGMLLYARTLESVVPDGKMKSADGNFIYFKTLDLNQKFEDIQRQLEDIIE